MAEVTSAVAQDHLKYMQYALALAKHAPPKPTNFCVGAVLVEEITNRVLTTGYTMELPGNTHAEQCCLMKYDEIAAVDDIKPQRLVIYTTMEPCNKRASGNKPCTETILETKNRSHGGIKTVFVGVREPEKFVRQNTSRAKLEEADIGYTHVPGLEEEILAVATAGHEEGQHT